jgi:hypothetical protein
MDDRYAIEQYGNGFIVADYSGERGSHGAAFTGTDGVWRNQPIGMPPFASKDAAEAFVKELG